MKLIIYIFSFSVLLFFSTLYRLSAQVVINEYSCSNLSNIVDNYNEYEDWIELYNTGAATITLTGYYLSDQDDNPTKWPFPTSTIPAGGYVLVFASGRDEFSGTYFHTNFKLTQTKPEHIVFSDPTGTVLEMYETIPTQLGHSWGRTPNGGTTWAIFTTPTPNAANSGTSYTGYIPKPVLSLSAGFYTGAQTVTIACSDPNAEIRYTTNGYAPIASSTLYAGPITISATTVLRAKAFLTSTVYLPSFIESNTFFIDVSHSVAVISVFSDKVTNLLNGGYISPETSLEYFDKDLNFQTEGDGYSNKHGNDSWAYQQRGIDFITRDQLGYNNALQYQIFARTPRDKYQRIILKAAANDNYPFSTSGAAHIRDAYVMTLSQDGHLALDERTYEPCVLYANGQYWGVYEIREKVDDADFIQEYYDQGEFDIQMLKTWGGTWSEYGGPQAQTDWDNFLNFVTSNDMSIPANYQIVKNQYSVNSLVDYFVLNSYVVCSDWLNWNTQWWRGMDPNGQAQKWQYCLWDEDATFGHYINYTGVPNTTPSAEPCNPEAFGDPGGQGHVVILDALMNNDEFWQYYVARFADLANTTFKCENMISVLDSMIDLIEPEMPAQIAKWGGSLATWEANVIALRDFINQRCAELAAGMIGCYNITGPYDITVDVDPPSSGSVTINSIYLYPYQMPWTAQYYGNMETLLKALPASSMYEFDFWETVSPVLPDSYADTASTTFASNQTVIAHFKNTMPILELGPDTAICAGTSITLNAGNPSCTFTWQNGSHNQTCIASTEGTYSVQVVSPSGYTASDSIHVTVIPLPFIDIGPDTSICPGELVHLNAETFADSYLWQDNSTTSYYNILSPGIYWVKAINECGTALDSIIVGEGLLPVINLGENQSILYGDVIYLDASYPFSTYLWQDLSADSVFTVTKPGSYWVIVTNSCGFSMDNIEITIKDYEIYIPTAFSPDNDGLNDYFSIYRNSEIEADFEILIYDRWGGLVFQSNDINFKWDGSVKDKETISTGVYTYFIKYKDFTGKAFNQTGLVTVVR